jgi:hypothetical protein
VAHVEEKWKIENDDRTYIIRQHYYRPANLTTINRATFADEAVVIMNSDPALLR